MRRTHAASLAGLLCTVAAGCHPEVKPDPGPNPAIVELNQKLDVHANTTEQMKLLQDGFVKSLSSYEKTKEAYHIAVAKNMATYKATPRAVGQVSEMANDGDRIAQELVSACTALNEALYARAESVRKALTLESQLWDTEWRYFAGKDPAGSRAVVEVKYLHEMETDLHAKQKDEQTALKALNDRELELWVSVNDDPKARDHADNELTDLRATLDKSFSSLLDAALLYDQADDKVHRRLSTAIAATDAVSFRIQSLTDRRAQAATELAGARKRLKDAIVTRAEKRAQEVAYDSEIAVVLTSAFKTPKLRDDFFVSVRPQRDAASDARVMMQKQEAALVEVRKKLVTLESEMQALGY